MLKKNPNKTTSPFVKIAKAATEYGEDDTHFLWPPYLPIADYSVLMAEGGTGKTILCCKLAAAVSSGAPLPEDSAEHDPRNVLIVSGEDSGELLKKRLAASGADLSKVFILDREDSIGLDLSNKDKEFEMVIQNCHPALIIMDPWHAFLGADININRVNVLRPLLQKIANLAKKYQCAVILVSHINKRAQGENTNNAAIGSADFINAARSAFRIVFDEEDANTRILVHTKSNYGPYGESLKYCITDNGGVKWAGTSPITRQTLEAAARRRSTPGEVIQADKGRDEMKQTLMAALKAAAGTDKPIGYSYDDFKKMHGSSIFGGRQPKRALDSVAGELFEDGFILRTCQVSRGGKAVNGFRIQRIDTQHTEQEESL